MAGGPTAGPTAGKAALAKISTAAAADSPAQTQNTLPQPTAEAVTPVTALASSH